MRVRSTGLGKQEMVADVEVFKRNGDYVVMCLKTSEPVKWKIRVAMTRKDLFSLIFAMLKGFSGVISCIMAGGKKEKVFSDSSW